MIRTKEDLTLFIIKDYFDDTHKKILTMLSNGDVVRNTVIAKELGISDPLSTYYLAGFKKHNKKGLLHLGLVSRVHDEYGTPQGFKITQLGKETLILLQN